MAAGRSVFRIVLRVGLPAGFWMDLGPDLGPFGIIFWHIFYNFLRPEFGHDFYMDLLMVSDLTDVINSQKYVRLFAKSEKSKVGKCIRIFIRFDHRLGMFFA